MRNEPMTATTRLARLSDLDDFHVAKGDPDPRGWTVKSADRKEAGKVKSLITDPVAMKVRYLDIELDKKKLNLDDDRRVLVPIGGATLDEKDDVVFLGTLSSVDLAALPPFKSDTITRDEELALRRRFDKSFSPGAGDFYAHEHFDDRRFFGRRRQGRENIAYITRSEEELAVGKRPVKAGEVEASKTIETKHVKEKVPVNKEEVIVERRPASATSKAGQPKIGKDEITVPVMEEEVVVQKRAVPKEEVVIKKTMTKDEKTVEADLKREKVDVDTKGDVDVRDRR